MTYAKPHLPYDQQLQLLASRGLTYGDQRAAIRALKSIGYYRFSAYTYVLRKPGEPTVDGSRPPRSDTFVDGATFEDALALCRFDHDLRLCLLDGLQQIEVGMRFQIGYQLGKTHPFAHLAREHLDEEACSAPRTRKSDDEDAPSQDAYGVWRSKFDNLLHDARGEDFVKHFHSKYDGRMPIWVATECLTFGSLVFLYGLLSDRDAKKIAENLDVRDRGIVHKWFMALNVLRNNCAHNSRVWNRSTIYPPMKPPPKLTHERLHHLREADHDRLYYLAALIGHFAIMVDPDTNWPRTFKTRMRKFPQVHGMTPENTMGFVEGWDALDLWNYDPKEAVAPRPRR